MGKTTIVIDNRLNRLLSLLNEARREKPKNLEKIISIRRQLYLIKQEQHLA